MSYWQDKSAIVTGASAGLGLAIAHALAAKGANVVAAARNQSKLDKAVADMARHQGRVVAVVADVTRQEDVDAMVDQAVSRFGALHLLVNNVGRSDRGPAVETTVEVFQQLWELNFLSAVRCTRAAAPHLLATKGHLVNIGSLAAKTASPFMGAYPATKFPLAAYSQQLRLEWSPDGVHVLLVCPGPIAREDAGRRYEDMASKIPESARKPGGGAKLKLLDPVTVSERILRACEQRKAEVVFPAKASLLFSLSQLSPGWGDWLLKKMTK